MQFLHKNSTLNKCFLLLITVSEAISIKIQNESKIVNRTATTVYPTASQKEKKFEDYQLLKGINCS